MRERNWAVLVRAGAIVVLALCTSGCVGLLYFDEPGSGSVARRAPLPPRPAPAAGRPGQTVVVRPGDTLYSIAFRNSLDYRELASWNGIGTDYTIYPGQQLRLSPPASSPPPRGATAAAPGVAPVPARPAPSAVPSAPAAVPAPAVLATASGVGQWRWPTAGTLTGRFDPPSQKGIDIAGAYGQNVVAAATGVVVYSGNALKGYGELVIIKHSDDYLSAYGFNQRRVVQEGETVRAGQVIAQMGEGPGQVPELHFEIRYKGQPVNPLKYLPPQ